MRIAALFVATIVCMGASAGHAHAQRKTLIELKDGDHCFVRSPIGGDSLTATVEQVIDGNNAIISVSFRGTRLWLTTSTAGFVDGKKFELNGKYYIGTKKHGLDTLRQLSTSPIAPPQPPPAKQPPPPPPAKATPASSVIVNFNESAFAEFGVKVGEKRQLLHPETKRTMTCTVAEIWGPNGLVVVMPYKNTAVWINCSTKGSVVGGQFLVGDRYLIGEHLHNGHKVIMLSPPD